ncbi:hypothetical protein [Streptomyces hydrogenans]|uniref:hypothetical protein n=1 Tax=Streptomyces hydrogenans TaxID=1873719 RepID=UPI00331CA1AE
MNDTPRGPVETEPDAPDLECQIYVAASSRDRLMERLAATLNVPLAPDHTLSYGCVWVEWVHNDYEGTGGDDFLDWHSLLVCQPRSDASPTAVVPDVATVLEAIRTAGYRAVPTCSYEELLPAPALSDVPSRRRRWRRSRRR